MYYIVMVNNELWSPQYTIFTVLHFSEMPFESSSNSPEYLFYFHNMSLVGDWYNSMQLNLGITLNSSSYFPL